MKKIITSLTIFLALTAVIINFSFNSSTLDNHATQALDSIAQQLKSYTDYTILLSGHTDNIGSDNYNNKLSSKRVTTVKNYLMSKGIDSTKIKFESYGETKPITANTSDSSRAYNRRVELTISGQKNDIAPPQTTSSKQLPEDTINSQKQESVKIPPIEKKIKIKRKIRIPYLVWTGWRTGFHWNTSGGLHKKTKSK